MALYSAYRLWFVPADIIAFPRHLGMEMEIALGSRTNVREVLGLLEVM